MYDFLINSPDIYTREATENRQSLEVHNQFNSGRVRILMHHHVKRNVIAMKVDVMPSQRLKEAPHSPWVALNTKDDAVIAAHCTYMAG